MTVEELKEKLLHTIAGDSAMPSLIQMVDAVIAAARAAQLKEDLAAVKRLPQYMVAVMEGWLEGSAPSAETRMAMNLIKGNAEYVEKLIPDLFPKEADNENQKD